MNSLSTTRLSIRKVLTVIYFFKPFSTTSVKAASVNDGKPTMVKNKNQVKDRDGRRAEGFWESALRLRLTGYWKLAMVVVVVVVVVVGVVVVVVVAVSREEELERRAGRGIWGEAAPRRNAKGDWTGSRQGWVIVEPKCWEMGVIFCLFVFFISFFILKKIFSILLYVALGGYGGCGYGYVCSFDAKPLNVCSETGLWLWLVVVIFEAEYVACLSYLWCMYVLYPLSRALCRYSCTTVTLLLLTTVSILVQRTTCIIDDPWFYLPENLKFLYLQHSPIIPDTTYYALLPDRSTNL